MIDQDPIIFGLICGLLGTIYYTRQLSHPFWRTIHRYVPVMVLCYFLPSLFNTFGVVDVSQSHLPYIAVNYFMPACLALLIFNIDMKSILQLGPKLIILFTVGAISIVLGGPFALMVFQGMSPDSLANSGENAAWRGMATLAGNWVGGTANQLAMKEVYHVGDSIFSVMITVNVVFSALWMTVLLMLSQHAPWLDKRIKADTRGLQNLVKSANKLHLAEPQIPQLQHYIFMLAAAFGVAGIGHAGADYLAPYFSQHYPELARFSLTNRFFWLVMIVTSLSFVLSYTRVRDLESVGSESVSSVMLFMLIAIMGLQMDITAISDFPRFFVIGFIWLLFHVVCVMAVGVMIKAPTAYMAIASQCNLGGAASAPVVAVAYHRSFAPVAVLLSVLGYGWATYLAWICGELLQSVNFHFM